MGDFWVVFQLVIAVSVLLGCPILPYVGLSFGASCPARVYFLFNSKKKVPNKVTVKKNRPTAHGHAMLLSHIVCLFRDAPITILFLLPHDLSSWAIFGLFFN
jgi:hypothetical protein